MNWKIEGAHVVSEGAYFRFLLVNHYGVPMYVTVNDGEPIYISTDGSVNVDVIAPQVSVPFEVVTYTFKEYSPTSQPADFMGEVDFPVTVLIYNFVDLVVLTAIIGAIGLFAVVIGFIIWHRRLLSGKVKLNHREPKDESYSYRPRPRRITPKEDENLTKEQKEAIEDGTYVEEGPSSGGTK